MKFNRKGFTDQELVKIYESILRPRMIEEKMFILLRQGKISKWFSGIGQEAISVGATLALRSDEIILPMHRNLGVFTTRKVPYHRLFAQFQGKEDGFTHGRDRSFHFGSEEFNIVGMISHLGPQLAVADGIALAYKLQGAKKVSLVFTGDGGSSEGDFHEALNVAAVWELPVIFIIENNGYGLSTPNQEQFKFKNFTDKGPGYGIKASVVDGNNVLEIYKSIAKIAEKMRKDPKPHIVDAVTFRMRGHEEASGTKYVPKRLMEKWAKKDPVDNFEKFLLKSEALNTTDIKDIREKITNEIDIGLKKAFSQNFPIPDSKKEMEDMFAPNHLGVINPVSSSRSKKRFVDAISDGLQQSLEKFPNLIFMGQDIAEYG